MFCPKCGTENSNENLWCVRCGNHLEPLKIIFQEEEPLAQIETAQETLENVDITKSLCEKTEVEEVKEGEVPSVKAEEKEPRKIRDYFIWSVLAAIFGSIVFGAAAVIFSGLTQTERRSGNREKAQSYSEKARLFCVIATGIGIAKIVFVVLFLAVFVSWAFLPFFIF